MKILLVAINAKFVQTNLAVRVLKAYAEAHSPSVRSRLVTVEVAEWNINQAYGSIVRGIYESCADFVLFSTYIWNREMAFRVAAEVRLVMPRAILGFGGPEVSWSAEKTLQECRVADLVISGEGEATLVEMIGRIADVSPEEIRAVIPSALSLVAGLYLRDRDAISFCGRRSLLEDLDAIPFPYAPERMDFDPAHRIVYYESSRGCPFGCAYCLSSLDTRVRYYPLARVLREIDYFMDAGFPLVKFVDRTFNLDPSRFLEIWKFIRDRHNGKTLFHFEIAAESLPEEAYALLETMPSGAVQFEIGIQSANPETLRLVGRPGHPAALAKKIARIPKNIHTHVDLIAGLPAENIETFARSFEFAFALDSDMLQLGFLKILPGTLMEKIACETEGYRWSALPPYEVLSSPVLPYGDLLVIKDIEQIVDTWYNSGLMRNALSFLVAQGSAGAFALFYALAAFARSYFPDGDIFLPRKPVDLFACMATFLKEPQRDLVFAPNPALERLRLDFLLQGKPGAFPVWFERRYSKEAHDRALEANGFLSALNGVPASRRIAYSRSEYERFSLDCAGGETAMLFIYPEGKDGKSVTRCIRLQ